MSTVRAGRRAGLRPVAVPLVDPMLDWTDRPRRSEAARDGLRLVALQVAGGWAYEIYRGDEHRPMQAGAVAGWTRAHAKDAAAGQVALVLGQRAPVGVPPERVSGRRGSQSGPWPQRLPLETNGPG